MEAIAATVVLDDSKRGDLAMHDVLAELTGTEDRLAILKARYEDQIAQIKRLIDTADISVNVIQGVDGQVLSWHTYGALGKVLRDAGFWGLIATAKGDQGYDFISRFFAPAKSVPEDPVTGSAHCALTPFWAMRLGKKALKARQVSPRGGDLLCTDNGARTVLSGPCALYMTAEIEV